MLQAPSGPSLPAAEPLLAPERLRLLGQQYLVAGMVASLHPRQLEAAVQPPQPTAAVVAEYTQSLQQAAATQLAAVKPATLQAQSGALVELAGWLSARSAATGRGLHNCTPDDLLAYMEGSWLPKHGELLLSDGQPHASPGYLSTTLSHLSTSFARLGREGEYDPRTQVRAPPPCTPLIAGQRRLAYHPLPLFPAWCADWEPLPSPVSHPLQGGVRPQAVGAGLR